MLKTKPSFYEDHYFTWSDIEYNKKNLIKFVRRLKFLRFFSFVLNKKHKKELNNLETILLNHDREKLNLLLQGEDNVTRTALIERWARIGSVEILIDGKFSKQTYSTIIKFPMGDYKLLVKRIQELVDLSQSIVTQDNTATKDIPGT
jgi:hypothetical protein